MSVCLYAFTDLLHRLLTTFRSFHTVELSLAVHVSLCPLNFTTVQVVGVHGFNILFKYWRDENVKLLVALIHTFEQF